MKLDDRIVRLIAVGASIAANCQPCLETNIKKALENGADEQEIRDAIEVGKRVREGAASKMDKYASGLGSVALSFTPVTVGECGCDSNGKSVTGGKDG